MKKTLLFLSLCILGLFNQSSAQALQLVVQNKTSCTVYYKLVCNYAPVCKPGFESVLIALSPGAVVVYTPPSVPFSPALVPALTAGDFINGAIVYSALPSSSCSSFLPFALGEPCSGYPNMAMYQVYEPTAPCKICKEKLINAEWVSNGAGAAQLVFTD